MIPHNLVEVVDAARHLLEHPDADPRRADGVRARPRPADRRPAARHDRGAGGVRDRPRRGPDAGDRRDRRAAPRQELDHGHRAALRRGCRAGHRQGQGARQGQEAAGHRRPQGPHRPLAGHPAGHRGQGRVQPAGGARRALPADAARGELRHQQRRAGRRASRARSGSRTCCRSSSTTGSTSSPGAPATGCARRRSARTWSRACCIALDAIDEVVRIIRASQDAAEARAELVRSRSGCPRCRRRYVLDMQLRRLVALEVEKLRGRAGRAARDDRRARGDPRPTRPCCAAVIADELAEIAARARHPAADRARRRRPQGAGHRPGGVARGGRRPGRRAAVLRRAARPHPRRRGGGPRRAASGTGTT